MKQSTPHALKALAVEGIKVILTGGNRTTANAVAKRLGISDVEAEVLPDQKSAVVSKLQKSSRVVAMAGGGVNDAPALAAAEVGIPMGTGSDVAMESAGVTLLKGDLMGIVRARRPSEAAMSNIRQNLFFAFIYNAAGFRSLPACSIRRSDCCCRRSLPRRRWHYQSASWAMRSELLPDWIGAAREFRRWSSGNSLAGVVAAYVSMQKYSEISINAIATAWRWTAWTF